MSNLDKCPFCNDNEHITIEVNKSKSWVRCNYCGAEGPPELTHEKAIKAWNTRASGLIRVEDVENLINYHRRILRYNKNKDSLNESRITINALSQLLNIL